MTWEQFLTWEQYFIEEPFGEMRADMRQAANTFYALGLDDPPRLTFPYFTDAKPSLTPGKELEELRKLKVLSPEVAAKLKAVRGNRGG